jgi:hypothetical protein
VFLRSGRGELLYVLVGVVALLVAGEFRVRYTLSPVGQQRQPTAAATSELFRFRKTQPRTRLEAQSGS